MKTTPRLDMNYTAKHFIYFKRLFILSVFNFCKNSPVRVNRRLVAIAKIKKKGEEFLFQKIKKRPNVYIYICLFVFFFSLKKSLL